MRAVYLLADDLEADARRIAATVAAAVDVAAGAAAVDGANFAGAADAVAAHRSRRAGAVGAGAAGGTGVPAGAAVGGGVERRLAAVAVDVVAVAPATRAQKPAGGDGRGVGDRRAAGADVD